MDGSKQQPQMTGGLDLGDKYSYLCLIDQQSGEVVEEGRLRTTPEALRRRFAPEPSLRIAIETGTHSPWVSRLLEECGHEVLVANARKLRLIYANKRKTDEIDALRTWLAWHASIRSCSTRSSTAVRIPRLIWRSSARVGRWSGAARNWSITSLRSGQILRWEVAQVSGQDLPQESQRAHPRGTSASSRAYLANDRLAYGAHPRLRPKAGGDLRRALPRNRTLEASRADRTAYGAHLRADLGRSLPFPEESLSGCVSGARAGH